MRHARSCLLGPERRNYRQMLRGQQGWRLSQSLVYVEKEVRLHDDFDSSSSFGACTDRGDWCSSDDIGVRP